MGASSSNSGPPALISASEHETETSLHPENAFLTNDERQRTYVGMSIYKREDQSRSQVCC